MRRHDIADGGWGLGEQMNVLGWILASSWS